MTCSYLADKALAEGWPRHSPVASNHYPDAVHGTLQRHTWDSREWLDVAVLYPPESEDDPTAGLWWVEVP